MSDLHTLGRWTSDRARTTPHRVAIDDRGVTVTYGELDVRAERLAQSMRRAGYGVGDRIATLTGNSADHVVAFFACAKAGLVLAPLSWRLSPRELAEQIEHAGPALLLVEDEFDALAAAAAKRLVDPPQTARLGVGGVEASVPTPSRHGMSQPQIRAVIDDDPLLLLYTSGTMAQARGVLLTHANCFWTNLSLSRTLTLTGDDVVLAVLPQFHVGGWNIQPLLAWWLGAVVVLERTFEPGRVLRLIDTKRVTSMMGVPANYLFLSQHPDFAAADLSHLRHALVGGAPMPEPLLRVWHARGVGLVQGYGLTEASPNVLCLAAEDARRKVGYAGKPYPYVEVAISEPATGEVLSGAAEGELLVRGPNIFAGYWRDEDATNFAMRGGWLHTGDLVRRDEEGYYRILDRLDDMYISGGENVSPAEVENVLYSHPAVAEAAVIGTSNDRWGQVGVAYVVLRHGVATDADDLLGHCRRELAGFKVPKQIHFVDELPHSSVGKVLRRGLRDLEEVRQ